MNQILAIELEVRLAVLFVLGAVVGGLANWAVYRLAWHPRPIGPWCRPDPKAPPRRAADRIPIFGWWGLRRETCLHGAGFWVRPMLLEILTGIAFAALYWWEIDQRGLLPPAVAGPLPLAWIIVLHQQYASHLILVSLMLVASVIDADEKIIPDSITVPGTLLGLLAAAACPRSLLPDAAILANGQLFLDFLRLTSPNRWPNCLNGFPCEWSLVVGLGCWWLWCVALMTRTWYTRHGWPRALRLCFARLVRESLTYRILLMGAIGSAAIAAVWWRGGLAWMGLLSAVVGVAGGGALIWMVRVIGTAVLKREAMGFGDVTLMAMIGAFLGWQTCLVIFFLAPFAALIVGALQWIVRRDNVIPYGPFLCLAAAAAIVRWATIWDQTWPVFAMGWLVPVMVLACMVLLALLLGVWQMIRNTLR